MPDGSAFNEFYYRNCCGLPYERSEQWLRLFRLIAERIVSDINPRRVLDAGCAIGLLVEALRDRQVDARGIDISSFAIDSVPVPLRGYCRQGSIAEPLGERFDLIVCIEVLEHMTPEDADRAITNFAAHTDDVLFSSTPFDYREPTHINVRMPEDWAEAFARHGFYRDVDFDASFVTKWAARFTRRVVPPSRLVRDYERRFWQARVAEHDARSYSMELQQRLDAAQKERDHLEETAIKLRQELQKARQRSLYWRMRSLAAKVRRLWRERDSDL